MSKKQKFAEPPREEEDDEGFDPLEFEALEDYQEDLDKMKRVASRVKGEDINNEAGIKQKLEELALPRDFMWVETLAVESFERLEVDENDDLKREAAFYQSSLAAVKQALQQLKQYDIPYERPLDFYAESVKPDSHMSKIKQILINDQKRLQEVEERKKMRESRKFAKQVHVERVKERAQQKRAALDEIDRLKKRSRHNDMSSASFKSAIRKGNKEGGEERGGRRERGGDRAERGGRDESRERGKGRMSKSEAKALKYGPKGRQTSKQRRNTSESSHDFSSLNPRELNSSFRK